MDNEIITALEGRIELLLESYTSMKKENARLTEEVAQLRSDREKVTARVDALLSKLESF